MTSIEYLHASRYGNGLTVAEEFRRLMAGRGVTVEVHHISEVDPKALAPADLYVFSSPGRFGRPIAEMGRFLREVVAPEGTRYAILTTELAAAEFRPLEGDADGEGDPESRYQRVIPAMDVVLRRKGMVPATTGRVLVTGLRGPLDDAWREQVAAFADRLA